MKAALLLLALSVAATAGENAAEARKLKLAYAQKLDALLVKAKAAGDAADAKEIEAMIAEVEGKASAAKDASELPFSVEETTRWAWGSGGELTIQANGKAKHSEWSKSGTWKRTGKSLLLISDAGVAFKVDFDDDGIGRVSSIAGDAKTTIVRKP